MKKWTNLILVRNARSLPATARRSAGHAPQLRVSDQCGVRLFGRRAPTPVSIGRSTITSNHTRAITWLRSSAGFGSGPISAQDDGVIEMAEIAAQRPRVDGVPGKRARAYRRPTRVSGATTDAGAEKTLAVYLMYDVQPVNPEDWESPPF